MDKKKDSDSADSEVDTESDDVLEESTSSNKGRSGKVRDRLDLVKTKTNTQLKELHGYFKSWLKERPVSVVPNAVRDVEPSTKDIRSDVPRHRSDDSEHTSSSSGLDQSESSEKTDTRQAKNTKAVAMENACDQPIDLSSTASNGYSADVTRLRYLEDDKQTIKNSICPELKAKGTPAPMPPPLPPPPHTSVKSTPNKQMLHHPPAVPPRTHTPLAHTERSPVRIQHGAPQTTTGDKKSGCTRSPQSWTPNPKDHNTLVSPGHTDPSAPHSREQVFIISNDTNTPVVHYTALESDDQEDLVETSSQDTLPGHAAQTNSGLQQLAAPVLHVHCLGCSNEREPGQVTATHPADNKDTSSNLPQHLRLKQPTSAHATIAKQVNNQDRHLPLTQLTECQEVEFISSKFNLPAHASSAVVSPSSPIPMTQTMRKYVHVTLEPSLPPHPPNVKSMEQADIHLQSKLPTISDDSARSGQLQDVPTPNRLSKHNQPCSFRQPNPCPVSMIHPPAAKGGTTNESLQSSVRLVPPITPSRPAPPAPHLRSSKPIVKYPGPMRGYSVPTTPWRENTRYPPPLPLPPNNPSPLSQPTAPPPSYYCRYYGDAEPRPYMPTTEPLTPKTSRMSFINGFRRDRASSGKSPAGQSRWSMASPFGGLLSRLKWRSAGLHDGMRRQFSSLSGSPASKDGSDSWSVDAGGKGASSSSAWVKATSKMRPAGSTVDSGHAADDDAEDEQECICVEPTRTQLFLQMVCCCCWPAGLAAWVLAATILRGRIGPGESCIQQMAKLLSWWALLIGVTFYFFFLVFVLSLMATTYGKS